MKILITGATGFVGKHLVQALSSKHEIFCLVRNEQKLKDLPARERLKIIKGDLFVGEPFPEDLEMVIHLASLTKALRADDFFRTNVAGTEALLSRLKNCSLKKFILLSSLAAAGPSDKNGITEDFPANPVSLYGKSKFEQEKIVARTAACPFWILRAPIVFGPYDFDMLVGLKLIKKGWLLTTGSRKRLYSIIFVKDLVKAIEKLIEHSPEQKIFYAANTQPIDWQEFMLQCAQLMGRTKLHNINLPLWIAKIAAESSSLLAMISEKSSIFNRDKYLEMKYPFWICNSNAFRKATAFECDYSLNDALALTINWYLTNNLL